MVAIKRYFLYGLMVNVIYLSAMKFSEEERVSFCVTFVSLFFVSLTCI